MGFQKGHKLSPGRAAGSLNKRSVAFYEAVQADGFEAAKAMIEIYRNAKKIYDDYGTIYEALEDARIAKGENPYPTEDRAHEYLKIALSAAKEIAAYCYPKPRLPSEEPQKYLDGMTPEQKLKALEHAASIEREKIKNGSNT